MGQSTTPTYRVEVKANTYMTHMMWEGKATVARLEQWVKDMNKSFGPTGTNKHIAKSISTLNLQGFKHAQTFHARPIGFVPYISGAKIVRQSTNEVVAEYNAPMFQVI